MSYTFGKLKDKVAMTTDAELECGNKVLFAIAVKVGPRLDGQTHIEIQVTEIGCGESWVDVEGGGYYVRECG